MEYGLALAGGGTRGAAHVGVLKALEEARILPPAVAGTSRAVRFRNAGLRDGEGGKAFVQTWK